MADERHGPGPDALTHEQQSRQWWWLLAAHTRELLAVTAELPEPERHLVLGLAAQHQQELATLAGYPTPPADLQGSALAAALPDGPTGPVA